MLTQQDINAIRAQRLANTHDPLALMANTQTPFHPDQSSLITYIQHPTTQQQLCPTTFIQHELHATTNANPEDITDPQLHRHSLELMSKAFHLNNTTPTNNNQRSSSNPCYSQIAQSREIVAECKNIWIGHECNSESRVYQNVGNQNRLSVFPEIANQYGNGNVVIAPAEGNGNGINGACKETEKVTANCNLQDNLQQASTSGTQSDKAPVYDSDGSAEVHHSENCYDDDIFNMFTQEEHVEQGGGTVEQHPANVEETRAYQESSLLNFVTEVEKVNMVNCKIRETNAKLTTELARYKNQEKCFEISQEKYDKLERCYQLSIYQEQCLTKKINALHLSLGKQRTTLNEEISNLNKQLSKEKSTVSSLLEEKKRLKSDFKVRDDKLLDKQVQLENKIKELDNILVETGQSIQTMHMLSPKPDSFDYSEHKIALGYQNPFYLKEAQQKQQSLYNDKVLLEKHDPSVVYDSEETLQLAQESRLKMKQLNKEIKLENYTKINHLSRVFVSQTAMSHEELYLSNTFNMANVSKSISIPNEEFLDDTTPIDDDDGDDELMMMMVMTAETAGGGKMARGGEWGSGLGRSEEEEHIWCSPGKSTGKTMSKRARSTRGQSSSSQGVSIEEKVRTLEVFESGVHQMRHDALARLMLLGPKGEPSSEPMECLPRVRQAKEISLLELGWRIGLYSERQSKESATLSGLKKGGNREKSLICGRMFVTRIAQSYGLLTNEMMGALSVEPSPHVFKKKSLISMGVVMKLHNEGCFWPATREVAEEDEEDDEGDEEAGGGAGHEGAGGSADMYRNMSKQDERAHPMYDHTVCQFQYLSTHDNLDPHLQIDPFPGRRSRSRSRIREVEEAEEEANHIKLNCFCSDEYPFRGTCKESATSSHVCTYFTH
ncbi:hypothetical protein Tco_0429359 [Tanacetum coccineum]